MLIEWYPFLFTKSLSFSFGQFSILICVQSIQATTDGNPPMSKNSSLFLRFSFSFGKLTKKRFRLTIATQKSFMTRQIVDLSRPDISPTTCWKDPQARNRRPRHVCSSTLMAWFRFVGRSKSARTIFEMWAIESRLNLYRSLISLSVKFSVNWVALFLYLLCRRGASKISGLNRTLFMTFYM